ncbi:hypothetical protein [Subsaximicrobium wynnwilliamsii]|nr:hypothetical protein [Subsaximicrobium wynnwilliamsii]
MKNTINLVSFIIAASLITISCSNDDKPEDIAQQQSTYINYSVAGNQVNDTFNITVEGISNPNITAVANVFPESDSPTLKKALIVFLNSGMLGVTMSIPARTGLVEILDDHPHFDMSFVFFDEQVELQANSISVEVQEIERNDIFITHIKGNFEGIAVYKHIVNGDEVEEPHIVDGEFEYYVPQ